MAPNLYDHSAARSRAPEPDALIVPAMLRSRHVPLALPALLFDLLVAAACGTPRPARMPSPASGPRDLTVEQQAAQAVNRLAFGPRPGDIERVAAMGVDRWIDRQLRPEAIGESALDSSLAKLAVWNASVQTLVQLNPRSEEHTSE